MYCPYCEQGEILKAMVRGTNEKMYLYDLVDIKKEASNPLKTTK